MATLVLLRGGQPRVRFRLGDQSILGRSSSCEVQILDPSLSRRHASISSQDGTWFVEDLGSRNGTRLNGEALVGSARLRPGDALTLGSVETLFDPPLQLLHAPNGEGSLCLVEADPGKMADLADLPAASLDAEALAEVHRLATELLGQLELERLLPALLERILAFFGADRGCVLLTGGQRGSGGQEGRLRPVAQRPPGALLAISRALVDRVLAKRRPILVRNALEDVSFEGSRSVVAHGLRAVMAIPLQHDGEILGLLQIDHQEPDAFDSTRLAQLALLGESAALAISNARRMATARRRGGRAHREERPFVGRSSAVRDLLSAVAKAAQADVRVLVTGESGTGKELISRMLHDEGPRADGPFVALHCAALPEALLESALFGHEKGAFTGAVSLHRGAFEQADGGTLFLDEIGEIAPSTQVRLLRVLQESTFYRVGGERILEVDVRVVAATNRDMESLVVAGRFREDLFYRLNVLRLHAPPLRERPDDIPELIQTFLLRFAQAMGRPVPALDPAAEALLLGYRWPGNIRELQNVVERLLVLGDGPLVRSADLPPEITLAPSPVGPSHEAPSHEGARGRPTTLREVLAETERDMVVRALRETCGHKAAACRLLGVSRPTLDKKIRDYGL